VQPDPESGKAPGQGRLNSQKFEQQSSYINIPVDLQQVIATLSPLMLVAILLLCARSSQ
jgi:hypothetical protein